MERRKVQVTGGSTFIISLPKRWADAHGIQQGDALDMIAEVDGPVTIYPVGARPAATRTVRIEVDPQRATGHTERRIIAAYLAGYETLIVESAGRFPAEHKEAVRRLATTLIGIEIVEETHRSIVLQDLLDPADFDLTRALERMHQLARAMVQDALTALRAEDQDLAQDVPRRDAEVDRLDWMVTKHFHLIAGSSRLAGQLNLTASDALHHLLVSTALERIGDHAARLGEILGETGAAQLPGPVRLAIADYGDLVLEQLDGAYRAFQKADFEAADQVLTACRDMAESSRGLLARGKGNSAPAQVALALLVKSVERVRSYTMDLAEAAIDHYMMRHSRNVQEPATSRRSG